MTTVITVAARRIARTGVLMAATATALSGCFTTTADFKSDAESFIAEQVPAAVGTEFSSVNCDTPANQETGTRFACQAIDTNGGVWEFDNVIDARNEFTVNISSRP